jgi:hypothetical protein
MASKKPSIRDNEKSIAAVQARTKALEAAAARGETIDSAELARLEKKEAKLKKVLELQREILKTQQDALDNFEDIDDELTSIGNRIGKNSTLFEVQKKRIEAGAAALTSISTILKTNQNLSEEDKEGIAKISQAYKENLVSIANINRRYAEGKIDKEEANKLIDEATQKYRENTASIELSNEAMKEVGSTIEKMNSEIESFGNLAQKSLGHIKHMDEIFESFEGIPALGEINKLLKTNIKDTLAFKAAVFALGAALGKAAFDYFGAPIKAAMQAHKEVAQTEIDGAAAVAKLRKDAQFIPAQIAQERLEHEIDANEQIRKLTEEAQYAGQKAAIQFSSSMQTGAAQFERAAKTALFGNKIGGIGYGAAQMQLAGIGADKIASAMEAAGAATGKMPTAKMGADMAIMAERTGQSVDDIAAINEAFQRMDGMSANVAMNMQEGMRNMADQAGIGLGNLMKEVAQASKEALGYQIKSGPALAKAVAYTQSMGVNFGDVAKAGKNMVMNYKESIKAEMQLSSMLGEQVDLAEVRAKFAAGDTEGALSSLKAQGLDPADMDMFQQQALQDALGGMDLNSLQKIATKDGANVGGLKGGNAKAGNQDFLSRTQSAEATMNAKQASISANTAILDAELSKKIEDAYLAGPDYAKYKLAQSNAAVQAEELATAMKKAWLETDAYKKSLSDSMKLNFVDGIKEKALEGAAALGGGLLASGLGKLGGKLFGKKGGATPGEAAAPEASEASGGGAEAGGGIADSVKGIAVSGAAAGADALVPGSGAVVESLAANVEAIEEPLEKAMTFGEKLKDFGKGIGSFLKSVGKGIGDAIGGILQGVARGLSALGTPQVLLGVVTMVGLGASLWVAGKGLQQFQGLEWETIGMAFTTLLGLGAVGAILGMVSPLIITGAVAITAMSVAFAAFGLASGIAIPNLMQFQSLDSGALTLVGLSLVGLAAGIGAFGAGAILGAIGSFFGGGVFDDLKDISNYANPIMATAVAVDALANAFGRLSSIDVSALTKIPWGDMEDFASEGGKFVLASSGGGSFALSKDTTDNIKTLSTDTKANLQVSKNLQALIAVLANEGSAGTQLIIDGRAVASMLERRDDNRRATKPTGGGTGT